MRIDGHCPEKHQGYLCRGRHQEAGIKGMEAR